MNFVGWEDHCTGLSVLLPSNKIFFFFCEITIHNLPIQKRFSDKF